MKATKGPWLYCLSNRKAWIFNTERGGWGSGYKRIADINHKLIRQEVEANAYLIAAAPDLLEALKGMLEWARRVKEINPGMEIFNAQQAISKAEGGG